MTWSIPPTKATGDFFTAFMWNTYVKDNPIHLRNITGNADPGAADKILISTGPLETNVAWSTLTDAAMTNPHVYKNSPGVASFAAAIGGNGFFSVNNPADAPDSITGQNWYCMTIADPTAPTTHFMQYAISRTVDTNIFVRLVVAGVSSGWDKIWTRANDGTGTTLDADTLDALNTSNTGNGIPVANGALSVLLNADKVDSADAGNLSTNVGLANGVQCTNLNAQFHQGFATGNGGGAVPVGNGGLSTNLNADQVDSFHAGNGTGQVPVSNGVLNTDLNAAMLGGSTLATILAAAGKVASGSYTGDATFDRIIPVGFACKFVLITGISGSNIFFGLVTSTVVTNNLRFSSNPSTAVVSGGTFSGSTRLHATDGFYVEGTGLDSTNLSAVPYRWVAIG